ncbi:MAG TPA: aquaporin [Candidatus Saccharimonadales bacterium]
MATKKSASTAKKSPVKRKTTSTAAKTTKAKATPVAKTNVTTTTVKTSAARSRSSKVFNFSRSPLLAASVAEFVGTFLLAAIILASSGSSIVALFGLTAIVLMVGTISGAYANPALTVGAWVTRRISAVRAVSYLVAQVLGALLALVVLNAFVQAAPEASSQMSMFGQQSAQVEVFKLSEIVKDKEWLFLAAELIGTAVFAFGVASTAREKSRMAAAFAVGGSLFVGLTITGYLTGVVSGAQAGPAVLNPAVATALQGFAATTWQNLWPLSVYLIAPAIGGVLGFALRDLIASESEVKA